MRLVDWLSPGSYCHPDARDLADEAESERMMAKASAKNKKTDSEKLLTIPARAGRAIVESGAVLACPLLGTDGFVKFCSDRGLRIDRERLIRLERLGLFSPVFRVRTPRSNAAPFYIPLHQGNNWFTKRWAYDTTRVPQNHTVSAHTDQTQEGYYSIFQIEYLNRVLTELTLRVSLDAYLDQGDSRPINWQNWLEYAEQSAASLRDHEYRRAIALLCQHISNRYFPQTQGDKRSMEVQNGSSSDPWIIVYAQNWDWEEEVQRWDPKETARLYRLTPKNLRHAYEGLARAQAHCDPLERWSPLTQFISLRERERLKGDALRAETIRAGAHMLRLLYEDLYEEELPPPDEVTKTVFDHFPEMEVRRDVRRYLEFVANRFGVNPQPRLSLIVEGQSEEAAVIQIFEEYYGNHPGVYGIEIIVLGGVDNATGSRKEDRFRAIFRLIDYLHHHQTFTFLILDNENYASRLKREAKKAKSIHSEQRYVTRPEYIRIWEDSFEFDNFSCTEIAAALNELAQGKATFTRQDVIGVKSRDNPGSALVKLYRCKTSHGLRKVELSKILVGNMMSSTTRRKVESRPIIKTLERVRSLAAQNPLPTTQGVWEINQASKYLGKKRKPLARKRVVSKPS